MYLGDKSKQAQTREVAGPWSPSFQLQSGVGPMAFVELFLRIKETAFTEPSPESWL